MRDGELSKIRCRPNMRGVPTLGDSMSIVAVLGAAFAALLFILFRMQQATHAARDIAEGVQEARGLFRGWAWRRKLNRNALDLIEDPREATAVLLTVTAEFDGNLSDAERQTIITEMAKAFGSTRKQGDELLAVARFTARDLRDPANVYRRLAPKLVGSLGPAERAQVVGMVEAVAAADGPADETLQRDIAVLREILVA